MFPTRLLRQAGPRAPMIKFLGKRIPPSKPKNPFSKKAPQIDPIYLETISPSAPASSPAPHPASPSPSLPDSFVSYRQRAIQHGPLGGQNRPSSSSPSSSSSPPSTSSSSSSSAPPRTPSAGHEQAYGAIGGHSGRELGRVEPGKGEAWDRNELPGRFGRLGWSVEDMEAVEMGGAGGRVGWGGS
ncbi:hypothetical protein MMC21_006941 [Puttea exsequens]|nr:hypothetical protein [Puttea exsequens]